MVSNKRLGLKDNDFETMSDDLLNEELEKAIQSEDYIRCAKIRDYIKAGKPNQKPMQLWARHLWMLEQKRQNKK